MILLKMKDKLLFLIFFGFLLLPISCSKPTTPKPRAHFFIDLPEPIYIKNESAGDFSFEISNQSQVEILRDSSEFIWFDIVYPKLNAKIHCSFIPVEKNNFAQIAEASKHSVEMQLRDVNLFHEQEFEFPEGNIYALIYHIRGNVASPTQFEITDSVRSFFRGSLYFDQVIRSDSIQPVLDYINNDIQVLIESFRWKR